MAHFDDDVIIDHETFGEIEKYANEFIESVEALTTARPTIGCIIPAYNEEESIGSVIESLLAQTRLPDVIHVIVNNTTDKTVEIAARLRRRALLGGRRAVEQFTEVLRPRHRQEPRQEGRRAQLRLHARRGHATTCSASTATPSPSAKAVEQLEERDRLGQPHRRHLRDLHDRRPDPIQGTVAEVPHRRPARAVRGLQHAEHAPRPQHGRARRPVLDLLRPRRCATP